MPILPPNLWTKASKRFRKSARELVHCSRTRILN